MNPRGWGFPAWVYLFAVARWLDTRRDIPGRQKKRWASRIGFILPCLTCEVHYLYVFKTKYDAHKYNHNLVRWFRYVYFRVKKLNNKKQKIKAAEKKPWKVRNVKLALMIFLYSIAFSYDAAKKIQNKLPAPIAHYPLYVRTFLQWNFGVPSLPGHVTAMHQHFQNIPHHWKTGEQILSRLDAFYHVSETKRQQLYEYLTAKKQITQATRPEWLVIE